MSRFKATPSRRPKLLSRFKATPSRRRPRLLSRFKATPSRRFATANSYGFGSILLLHTLKIQLTLRCTSGPNPFAPQLSSRKYDARHKFFSSVARGSMLTRKPPSYPGSKRTIASAPNPTRVWRFKATPSRRPKLLSRFKATPSRRPRLLSRFKATPSRHFATANSYGFGSILILHSGVRELSA